MLFPMGSMPNAPRFETRKALLMIDLQNDFANEDGNLFVQNVPEFIPKLPSLVQRFREQGEIFWVRTEFEEARPTVCPETESYTIVLEEGLDLERGEVPNTGRRAEQTQRSFKQAMRNCGRDDPEAFLARRHKKNWPRCCLPNSAGSEMDPTVARLADMKKDVMMVKSDYSAFHNKSLLATLRTKLITQLYLCGSLSNVSVYATALDAVQHGLEVTVIEDCVGYREEKCHREAMRQMADAMGVNGTDYQELMDDLCGLLGDVVTPSTFQSAVGTRRAEGDAVAENYSMRSKIKRWIDDTDDHSLADGDQASSEGAADIEVGSAKRRSLGTQIERKTTHVRKNGRGATSAPQLHTRLGDTNYENEKPGKSASRPSPVTKVSRVRIRRPGQVVEHPNEDSHLSEHVNKASPAKEEDKLAPSPTGTRVMEASPDPVSSTVERVQAFSKTLRAGRRSRQPGMKLLGPGDVLGARDSRIIYDFLPPTDNPSDTFARLSGDDEWREVRWQKMFHRSGEVPRLVAVQGEVGADGSIPIYRHPADESPGLLPFSSTVRSIRDEVEKVIGHPFNHVLIQRYRSGDDGISEHSDKTLDIVPNSSIVNVSLGAMRTMTLRTKRSACASQGIDPSRRASMPAPSSKSQVEMKRGIQRIPLPHNSLFVLGQTTNQIWLHAIRTDKRPSSGKSAEEAAFKGERISLTFRHIGTFIVPDPGLIWGQGASSKTKEGANRILQGVEANKEHELMIRAFGQENHQSHDFDWYEQYGSGFDVIEPGKQESTGSIE